MANIKKVQSSFLSSSTEGQYIDDPDFWIIGERSRTPVAIAQGNLGDGDDSIRETTGTALLQALMKKHTSSSCPEARDRSKAAKDMLVDRLLDAAGDDSSNESDDSKYLPLRHRRTIGNGRTSSGSQTPPGLHKHMSPDNAVALVKKKRKRTEVEEHNQEGYHDECHRRNVAPQLLYEEERLALGILKYKPWLKASKTGSRPQPSNLHRGHTYLSSPFSEMPQIVTDSMSVKDRKRFFIYTPTKAMREAMQEHVSRIYKLFPPTRKISDCMLHPNPGRFLKGGQYNQVIPCTYMWNDAEGPHVIHVNFGLVAIIVNYHLTEAQKEGYIEHAWHLSHLCGNWICCNWRHHTVEPGPMNIGRNGCFNSTHSCTHIPPCMKEKKRVLDLPTTPRTPRGRAGTVAAELSMELEDEVEPEQDSVSTKKTTSESEVEEVEVVEISSDDDPENDESGSYDEDEGEDEDEDEDEDKE